MENKYFAIYKDTNDVLVFDTAEERDEFCSYEQVVHPDCVAIEYDRVKDLIAGKEPVFDHGFGCMAILD